jgi:hypothetical protein
MPKLRSRPTLASYRAVVGGRSLPFFDDEPCADLVHIRNMVQRTQIEPEDQIAASLERWADRRYGGARG